MNTSDTRPPKAVFWAATIAILQSGCGVLYAFILIVREALGYRDPAIVYQSDAANTWVGFGTAVFFLVIFGTVILAAIFMMKARRWGRGPVIMLEMMLVLISYYIFSAHQIILAIGVAASAIGALIMLFSPRAVAWAARQY